MNLDNFKDINDQYGHHIGDRALRDIASVLARWAVPAVFGDGALVGYAIPARHRRQDLNMMVDRVRDGVEGRVSKFDANYPYYEFAWLVVPANLETFRVTYQ